MKQPYTTESKKAETTRGNKELEKPKDTFDPNLVNIPNKFEKGFFDDLIKQVEAEYQLAYTQQKNRLQRNLIRLQVYNNQKKSSDDVVGDPLLFTVMQTVLASLYDDSLMVDFQGKEQGDEETAENLTATAEHDYTPMKKDQLDYYWDWDSLFTGRGLIRMYEFNRDKALMCPVPELVDPFTFLRDPDATSVNGLTTGKGGMRFGGRELKIGKWEIIEKNGYFNIEGLQLGQEIKSLLQDVQSARDNAQGRDDIKNKSDEVLGDNANVPVLEWRTHYKGKKCIVWLANGRKKPIKYVEIGSIFDPKVMWDLVDRPMYPTSHDWDGTSIPDLVEDKQRQRAVMINLGIQSAKGDMYPMYLYDEARIKNKSDLKNFAFNKFVAVQGDGGVNNVVQPMNKSNPNMNLVAFILNTLDISAQKATATPDIQQGMQSNKDRPLGETNLIASKVDTRYSLSAKVFGWSEREFWARWYNLYKKHFKKGIDEKIIRIQGSYGTKWRALTKENLNMIQDPDIKIESKAVSENKQVRDRILLNGFAQLILGDPNANKLYFMRKLAKFNGLSRDEVKIIYPDTLDELIAEKENLTLNEDNIVAVGVNDADLVHLEIHSKASETKAKMIHIQAHIDSMMIKRSQPELFAQGQLNQAEALNNQGQGATPIAGQPAKVTPPSNAVNNTKL